MSVSFAPRAILITTASTDTVWPTESTVLWIVLISTFNAVAHDILVTPPELFGRVTDESNSVRCALLYSESSIWMGIFFFNRILWP